MSKNFLDPAVREKLINDKVLRPLENAQKATALAIFGQLIENTPVGNPSTWQSPAPKGYTGGQAKSNWWMDINSVSTVLRENDNAANTQSNALSVLARDLKPDATIFISNNLPYINRLNNGWSGQQPTPGWVEGAVQVGQQRGLEAAKRRK